MTARRPLLVVTAGCVAATALGLVFGQGSPVALGSALALATALAAAAALELRPTRKQQPPPPARDHKMPLRLRQIADDLRESEQSEPASTGRSDRCSCRSSRTPRPPRRRMALAPRRAQELLGDVLWEILRPDRPSAAYRVGRGVAGDDLRTAIERLEPL